MPESYEAHATVDTDIGAGILCTFQRYRYTCCHAVQVGCGLGIVFAANARVTFNLPAPSACGPALPDASAVVAIIDFISYGVRFGFLSIRAIAAPVTCGAAKLVPLTMEYSPPTDVVLMYTPGATRSGFM